MSDTPVATPIQQATVPLEQIHVDPEHNPRTTIDERDLTDLAQSITEAGGILVPLIVSTRKDGDDFTLIAGHRRLAAAKLAGLSEVPICTVNDSAREDALRLAIIENLQREDLNPIDEARALKREQTSQSVNQKQLAKRIGKSPTYVAERLRLLKLPEQTQQLIAAGSLPLIASRTLEPIAKAAPDVADRIAVELASSDEHDVREFIDYPAGMLDHVARLEDGPFLVPEQHYGAVDFTRHGIAEESVEAARERIEALAAARHPFRWRLTRDDADAAAAYGCLLEVASGPHWTSRYFTDAAWVFDRLLAALDTAEEAAQQAATEPQPQDEHAPAPSEEADPALAAQRREERMKQQRREERAEQQRQQQVARRANLELGHTLQKKLGAAKLTQRSARLVALLVLRAHPDLAAGGIRYTHETYQDVSTRTTKSGAAREKVSYAERQDAEQALVEWVIRPSKPEEILGRLLQALVAGAVADTSVVAQSSRIQWAVPGAGYAARIEQYEQIGELIDKLAAPLLPDHFKPADERRETEHADAA